MKSHPEIKVSESAMITVDKLNIAYFDFIIPAADTGVYNLLYVFSLKGTLMMGTFNCLEKDMEDWQDIFFQMMHSIGFE